MTDTAKGTEWFEAIDGWPAASRRAARIAAILFAVLLPLPLLARFVAPSVSTGRVAPMPKWDATEFASGKSMKLLEGRFRETSWMTVALRSVHDALHLPVATDTLGTFTFETSSGERFTVDQGAQLFQRGFVVPVPWQTPRPRLMIAPNQTFWLCYRDNDVLRRDWFDAKSRVEVRVNQYGLRERGDLLEQKPAGEQRVLVLGDSLAFGWGVPEEKCWVRLLEEELRGSGRNVRTVNCGGTMAVCVDEYSAALTNRFAAFGPDVVVVTLCLNDLIPSSGLSFEVPLSDGEQSFADALAGKRPRTALDLDPSIDWVSQLLKLPRAEGEAAQYYNPDRPFEAMWSQGVPQQSLRDTKAWCEARGARLVVVLWPFLQGLGRDRWYPFESLHAMVAAQCATDGIAFVDVLPSLRGIPQEDLWVSPADMHPNPRAHRLAIPAIRPLVESALPQ